MDDASLSYEAVYSPVALRQAGYAFRDYQFKRYGQVLIAACVLNAAALAYAFWLGADRGAPLLIVAALVVLGPVWLLYKYFVGPRTYAMKLRLVLASTGQVAVSRDSIALPGRSTEAVVFPWSMVKVVLEQQSHFLLVLSPFSSYFVPRPGMPVAAYDILHSKSARSAA
jgi:hypothetical protein